eukprot:6211359-Pleurochrysis_carterae.AAC.1
MLWITASLVDTRAGLGRYREYIQRSRTSDGGAITITIYTLLRCACVRERALCDASQPLPALACAADNLERARSYAKTDLDAEEVWYSKLTFSHYGWHTADEVPGL